MINIKYEQQLKLEDFTEDSHQTIREYICSFCFCVLVEPVVDHCGHIFCKKCILASIKNNPHCPQSHEPIVESELNNMGFIEKILEKQTIYCKNKENDCNWVGKYQFLENHLKINCPKHIINCGNYGCKESILREDSENHLKDCQFRLVPCNYCESSIAYNLVNLHSMECPRFPIECTLKCGLNIERKQLENHIKTQCEHAEIKCYFNNYGCETLVFKRQMEEHLKSQNENHNLLISKFISDFYKQFQDKISSLESTLKDINCKILQYPKKEFKKEDENFINNKKRKRNLELETIQNDEIKEITDSNCINKHKIKQTKNFIDNSYINSVGISCREDDEENKKELVEESNLTNPIDDSNWTFNTTEISNGLSVEKNKVVSKSMTKNIHLFSFINANLKNDSNYKWRVNINRYSTWIAFGVCDKAKVINNNYVFSSTQPSFNNGCYLLSSNYYSWNSNNPLENNKLVRPNTKLSLNDTVIVEYNGKGNEIIFSNGSFIMKLTKVKSKEELVPCVIFLCNGDEISIDFLKE